MTSGKILSGRDRVGLSPVPPGTEQRVVFERQFPLPDFSTGWIRSRFPSRRPVAGPRSIMEALKRTAFGGRRPVWLNGRSHPRCDLPLKIEQFSSCALQTRRLYECSQGGRDVGSG